MAHLLMSTVDEGVNLKFELNRPLKYRPECHAASTVHILCWRFQCFDFSHFSFCYDSAHEKYQTFETLSCIAHYEYLWHRVRLCNKFSALEYLVQR